MNLFRRAKVHMEIFRAKDHPSADDIYKRIVKKLPNISFDTANRTLLTFSEIGITNVVEGMGNQSVLILIWIPIIISGALVAIGLLISTMSIMTT